MYIYMYICIYNEEELSTILIIYSSGFSYQNQLVFPCFFPFKTTTVNNGLQVSLPPPTVPSIWAC